MGTLIVITNKSSIVQSLSAKLLSSDEIPPPEKYSMYGQSFAWIHCLVKNHCIVSDSEFLNGLFTAKVAYFQKCSTKSLHTKWRNAACKPYK